MEIKRKTVQIARRHDGDTVSVRSVVAYDDVLEHYATMYDRVDDIYYMATLDDYYTCYELCDLRLRSEQLAAILWCKYDVTTVEAAEHAAAQHRDNLINAAWAYYETLRNACDAH